MLGLPVEGASLAINLGKELGVPREHKSASFTSLRPRRPVFEPARGSHLASKLTEGLQRLEGFCIGAAKLGPVIPVASAHPLGQLPWVPHLASVKGESSGWAKIANTFAGALWVHPGLAVSIGLSIRVLSLQAPPSGLGRVRPFQRRDPSSQPLLRHWNWLRN